MTGPRAGFEGRVLIFDDANEHEAWNNNAPAMSEWDTAPRLMGRQRIIPRPGAKPFIHLVLAGVLVVLVLSGSGAQLKPRPPVRPGLGASFRDCPNCPEMVVVPAGTFTMGSPASEPGHQGCEGPQRRVTIAKPFAVGKFAVTFAEWDACVAAGGCNGYKPDDKEWGREDRPVINVRWDDAKAYIA